MISGWAMLGAAIALEIVATSLLKASDGFARPLPGVGAMALYALCFWIMAYTFQRVPMGVAYAIWSGVGMVAIAVIGLVVFRQPLSLLQWLCIALIVVGATGLHLTTAR